MALLLCLLVTYESRAQKDNLLSEISFSIIDTTYAFINTLPKHAKEIEDEFGLPTKHYRTWGEIEGQHGKIVVMGNQTKFLVSSYSKSLIVSENNDRLYNIGYAPIGAQSGLINIELFDLTGKLIKRCETDIIALPMSSIRALAADGSFWVAGMRYEEIPKHIGSGSLKNRKREVRKTKLVVAHFDKDGNLLREIETSYYDLVFIPDIAVSADGQYVIVRATREEERSFQYAKTISKEEREDTSSYHRLVSSTSLELIRHDFYFNATGNLIHKEEARTRIPQFLERNLFFREVEKNIEILKISNDDVQLIYKSDLYDLLHDKRYDYVLSKIIALENNLFAFLMAFRPLSASGMNISSEDYVLKVIDVKSNRVHYQANMKLQDGIDYFSYKNNSLNIISNDNFFKLKL